jgi:hypothetical protein
MIARLAPSSSRRSSGLFDPNEHAVMRSALNRLKPSAAHWLGTDELGPRHLSPASPTAAATRSASPLAHVAVAVIAGTALGLLAGFFRALDAPLMRVIDAMMAFPDILLAIALVAHPRALDAQCRAGAGDRLHAARRARRARLDAGGPRAALRRGGARARRVHAAHHPGATCCPTACRRCWCS